MVSHVSILGRTDISPEAEIVTDVDGKQAILDLMVYRRFAGNRPKSFEHLVIELKRPACKLGQKEIGQIELYGLTVARDERFKKSDVHWKFLLIGNDIDEFAEEKCNVANREFGHIYQSGDCSVNVHVRTWASIIDDAKWRYEFLRKQLALQISKNDGVAYLRTKYADKLPKDCPVQSGTENGKSPKNGKPAKNKNGAETLTNKCKKKKGDDKAVK